jgi:osmoprotectant transport system permease protein
MIAAEPLIRWDWLRDHLTCFGTDCIPTRLWEHVVLTLLAVGIGCAISLPVALYAQRHRRLYTPVTLFSGFLYTIPSLALFVLLIPFTGISILTAEIGLVSYTLLILIRNIVAGLDGVEGDVKEAALGMGYTAGQQLQHVELPLALPAIIAGVRIATVTTIGLVTVTALIGYGGMGHFILDGLQTFFSTATLLGAIGSVLLAIVADTLLVVGERLLTPWARRRAER